MTTLLFFRFPWHTWHGSRSILGMSASLGKRVKLVPQQGHIAMVQGMRSKRERERIEHGLRRLKRNERNRKRLQHRADHRADRAQRHNTLRIYQFCETLPTVGENDM